MKYDDHVFGDDLREPIDILHWALSLVTWDGLLVVVMIVAPGVLRWLWPQDRQAQELGGTLLVMLALGVRVFIGRRHIARNHCGPVLRKLQTAVLFMMALFLLMIDCILIDFGGLPQREILFIVSTYVGGMAFVLYPGRRAISDAGQLRADR